MSSGWSEPSAVHHGGYQEQYDRSLIATWSGFFTHSYCLNGAHVISIKTPTPIPDSPAVLTWGSRLSAGTTCRQEGEGKEVGMVQEDHDTPPPIHSSLESGPLRPTGVKGPGELHVLRVIRAQCWTSQGFLSIDTNSISYGTMSPVLRKHEWSLT